MTYERPPTSNQCADGKCVGFATGCAGKDFPADVWVCAKDGKLVEVGE